MNIEITETKCIISQDILDYLSIKLGELIIIALSEEFDTKEKNLFIFKTKTFNFNGGLKVKKDKSNNYYIEVKVIKKNSNLINGIYNCSIFDEPQGKVIKIHN